MPDTATTAEVEVQPAAAEPAEEAPPNPEQPEGGAAPEPEGSEEREIPAGLDKEATEAWLDAEAERRAEERAAAKEAEAEKRVKQRVKEADDGHQARQRLYDTAAGEAQQSFDALVRSHEDGEPLKRADADHHLRRIAAGISALTARENESVIASLRESLLPDETDAESEVLEPLLYDFRRNGRFDALVPKVTELALARKDAEIADLRKQLSNRANLTAAAEKLANTAAAAGNGVGSETPKGKAAGSPAELTRESAQTLPIEKLIEIRNRQKVG